MKVRETTDILARLRQCMLQRRLNAYIVPTEDEHLVEFCSHEETRRSFISGFTGSRGVAIITEKSAALWTDGRYFLQAANEIDNNWVLMKEGLVETLEQTDWLRKELPSGGHVGLDPYLLSAAQWTVLSQKLSNFDLKLLDVSPNLVDEIWTSKPSRPSDNLIIQPLSLTGKGWVEKVRAVQKKVADKNAASIVITKLDDIAWLLNLRGNDIQHHPLFYSYVVIDHGDVHLFVEEGRLDDAVRMHLGMTADTPADGLTVHIHKYDSIQSFINELSTQCSGKIWISENSSQALVNSIPPRLRLNLAVPIAEMKAVKNEVELAAMRRAHVKDAVSLCEFFVWLEKEVPSGAVTEVSAAHQLDQFKRVQEGYMGPSFDFISSVGANASVIHYSPSPETDKTLNTNEVYLCDTGAQFREGTTDVTRVLHFATPTAFEKECFTRVLQGHIAISNAVFPDGIKGSRLDTLARTALWDQGLDYMHGTGHGVGSYLCVHEGPYGIATRSSVSELSLKENMIISNEPGYYEDGQFGVRVESLVQIVKAKTQHNYGGKQFLTFDEVTLVPIQLKMIERTLLSPSQLAWLNDYHARCRAVVGTELVAQGKQEVYDWLVANTNPL